MRNGAPISDEAKLKMRLYRHGGIGSILRIIGDPIFDQRRLRSASRSG
jgi:hypothetical protein